MPTLEQNAFIRELLRPLPGGVVVELGANVGEEEHWIRESFGGPVHYVMVEPDLHNCLSILESVPLSAVRLCMRAQLSDRYGLGSFITRVIV